MSTLNPGVNVGDVIISRKFPEWSGLPVYALLSPQSLYKGVRVVHPQEGIGILEWGQIDGWLSNGEFPKEGTVLRATMDALLNRCHTLPAIAAYVGKGEATVSARIRELRNKYGWRIRTVKGKGNTFHYFLRRKYNVMPEEFQCESN